MSGQSEMSKFDLSSGTTDDQLGEEQLDRSLLCGLETPEMKQMQPKCEP